MRVDATLSVLLIGIDPRRLESVRGALALPGFSVRDASAGSAAIGRAAAGRTADLGVIVHAAPANLAALPVVVRNLISRRAAARVVIYGDDADAAADTLLALASAGADGWLVPPLGPEELRQALRAVHRGAPAYSPRQLALLLGALRHDTTGAAAGYRMPSAAPGDRVRQPAVTLYSHPSVQHVARADVATGSRLDVPAQRRSAGNRIRHTES